ncbi:hypothetical protein MSG28_002669, partial [Choristoneura fumiferana]
MTPPSAEAVTPTNQEKTILTENVESSVTVEAKPTEIDTSERTIPVELEPEKPPETPVTNGDAERFVKAEQPDFNPNPHSSTLFDTEFDDLDQACTESGLNAYYADKSLIMSARNYLSAREKSINKFIDSLPVINSQKFNYRSQELPALSASKNNLLNRNLNYSYEVPYGLSSAERATTPFSDFFSESETGTPDFRSEESDSSSGSALRRSNAEATKTLLSEWERIERTLYNEEGEKSSRPQIIEECKQWRQLHPQLRVVGKAIPLPDKRLSCRTIEHEEVIAMHYSDYEEFSESEERLSQSSTDVTPQNSPRVSIEDLCEPKLMREKVSFYPMFAEDHELPDTFCSLLQITPIHIHSPLHKKRQNPFIKSEIASSRWMRNSRPDSSVNYDRNSAKSFVSLDPRTYGNLALSATEKNNGVNMNGRVITARSREPGKLEPLYTPELHQDVHRLPSGFSTQHNARKVSLPPLLLEEEKRKVSSAKKHNIKSRRASKNGFHLDRGPSVRALHSSSQEASSLPLAAEPARRDERYSTPGGHERVKHTDGKGSPARERLRQIQLRVRVVVVILIQELHVAVVHELCDTEVVVKETGCRSTLAPYTDPRRCSSTGAGGAPGGGCALLLPFVPTPPLSTPIVSSKVIALMFNEAKIASLSASVGSSLDGTFADSIQHMSQRFTFTARKSARLSGSMLRSSPKYQRPSIRQIDSKTMRSNCRYDCRNIRCV